jgi:hypothetical protein
MTLASTTLASPLAVTDTAMIVSNAASIAIGRLVDIDQETVQVTNGYVAGNTLVPILRGREGTATVAHRVGASVTHGTAADFAVPAPQNITTYPTQRSKLVTSLTASGTLSLPPAGSDMLVVLNGTTVINLTVPPPTKDMDDVELTIVGNGAAAHVITFTGGLSGAGAGYTTLTNNASAPTAIKVIAINGAWVNFVAGPMSGTATKIISGIA